jgi:hypothetical protein
MAKTFYTEHDIEDMVRRGTLSLTLTDDTVLTDLAYERASKLGLKLVKGTVKPPSAPERPYISKMAQTAAKAEQKPCENCGKADKSGADVRQRVREAVIARLGGEVDAKLLDSIITRVLDNVGVK